MAPGPRRLSPGAAPAGSASAVVCAHLWITGRVQGVGFRVFVLDHAQRLGLSGFVRNLPDRRVEIVAEGAPRDVETLLRAAERGPAGARVAAMDVTWESPRGGTGFSIREDARA